MEGKYYEDVKKGPIMTALLIASFFSFLGETLLNVALPRFMAHFGVSAETAGWLITGYLLVIGIGVPAAAYLIRKFRTRVLFLVSLLFFIIGAIICALAQNFPMLLAGRFIQAFGTAIIIPLNLNVILVLNPPEKRGMANGIYIFVLMFAPSIGPTLSGIILEHFSWRALFWLIIPFLVFAFIVAMVFMKDVTKTSNPKFDWLSMILSSVGFGFSIYALSIAASAVISFWVYLIIGLVSLAAFIHRQFHIKEPMLDLRVFKYANFTLSSIFMAMGIIALFSNLMMMPLYLQKVLGISAFTTGLVMMPGGLADGFMAPISGKIYDKFGGNYLLIIGFFIIGVTLFYFTFLGLQSSLEAITIVLIFLGLGIPLVMTASQTSGLNSLPPKLYPHGTAVFNTVQQISAALGSSAFLMIMSAEERRFAVKNAIGSAPTAQSMGEGIRMAYGVGCLFVIPVLLIAIYLLLKKHKI